MICKNCCRETPDGTPYCLNCGGPFSPSGGAPLRQGVEPFWQRTGARKYFSAVFRPAGRINRLQFATVLFMGIVGFVLCIMGLLLNRLTFFTVVKYLAIVLLLIRAFVTAAAMRFHDLNKPGKHALFTLIPVYNIYVVFKLLFFKSNTEPNNFGERENNTRFWMVPIAILLISALFFGTGAMYQRRCGKPVFSMHTWHHYDQRDSSSADVACGVIGGSFKPTSEKPFSEYTEEELSNLAATYGTAEAIAKMSSYLVDKISILSYRIEDINGKKFIRVTFRYASQATVHCIIGIYESREYRFDFSNQWDANLLTRYSIERTIQSIRVGKDAIP